MKITFILLSAFLVVLFMGPLFVIATSEASLRGDWRTASRHSAEIAPSPVDHPQAVVQVYAARAFAWRGAFGVHTWLAVKESEAAAYEVYEVLGWRGWRGASVVSKSHRTPDAFWYGSKPELLLDIRGDKASRLIPSIRSAVDEYPFADRYEIWPGPNSNTFTAFIARAVDGLDLQLPVTAVGKDYLPSGVFARAPSGSGFQLSLKGMLGLTLALDEGLEFNLLGLSFGIDFRRPALKLPGIGRIGFASTTMPPISTASITPAPSPPPA